MRQAIVEIIGMLIQEVAPEEGEETDAKKKQKQINNFFGLLLERVLDLSPYVRAKVFNVFSKLVNVKILRAPKQRLNITTAAVDALDDKSASVRMTKKESRRMKRMAKKGKPQSHGRNERSEFSTS
jgi:condensin complex subunit 1